MEVVTRKIFRDAIGALPIDYRRFVFIDFGSGKGRAILLATEFPFKRIVGVEFSEELHRIAQDNIRRFRSDISKCKDVESVCMDAVDYPLPDDCLVCYFCNPFDATLMAQVLSNIRKSFLRNPREIFIVYYNPKEGHLVDQADCFTRVGTSGGIRIWRTMHMRIPQDSKEYKEFFMIGLLPTEYWEYKFSDIIRGLAAALGPRKPNGMLYIAGLGNCIPARSARAGLVAAIRALDLPPGARIGVPLYCCPVVFKAIKAAGCTARFIDVEPATYCMSAEDLFAKRSQVDAVIAVHMFGNLCDMPGLQEAAQGKPIIEDCAQSLGSKLDGRMAGSFGTIAVFSFRSGKYLSVGEGGALFSSHADVRSRLSQLISEMPAPSRAEECVHVAKTYIRSMLRSKPLYGVVGYPLWYIYNKKVDYSAKSPIVLSQIYRSDLAITINRLALLDSAIERQRANADFYSRTLKLDSGMLCSEKPGTFYNRYLYPIIFPSSEHRDLIAAYLHSRQIDTAKPYKDIADVAAAHYGYAGDCPVAEQIAKRVLVIPSHYSLKKKDVATHCSVPERRLGAENRDHVTPMSARAKGFTHERAGLDGS